MELIDKIRAIDQEAAEYLENVVIPNNPNKRLEIPDDLTIIFIWELTPQGNEYWRNIYLKLNDR